MADVATDGAAPKAGLVSVHRRLSPAQIATRGRLLDAAVELATSHGYDELSTRAVAVRAEVAIATFYRYFTSKDHVLAQAMVDLNDRIVAEISARPPRRGNAIRRTEAVFEAYAEAVDGRPLLTDAFWRAAVSNEPAVVVLLTGEPSMPARLFDIALGEVEFEDRDDVAAIFVDVSMAALAAPGVTDRTRSLVDRVERAARLLLKGVD